MDTQMLSNVSRLFELEKDIQASYDGKVILEMAAGKLKATVILETLDDEVLSDHFTTRS
jgi:hypothetical protein